jgi:hypothetical protein
LGRAVKIMGRVEELKAYRDHQASGNKWKKKEIAYDSYNN